MALPSSLVWEVRTTGNDLNSGAFDAGLRASGTDYSQQDAAKAVYSDLSIDAADGTKVTSVGRRFLAADVGNTIRIPAGIAGFTAGVYSIRTVSGGVAGLDRACGTTGASQGSGSIRLGGAIASLSRLSSDMVAQNLAFVKAGDYSEPGTVTFTQGPGTPTPSLPPSRVIGYSVGRSDYGTVGLTRPSITVAGTSHGLIFRNSGWLIQNLIVTGVGLLKAIQAENNASVHNCKVSGFTDTGIFTGYNSQAHYCEVTGATALKGVTMASGGLVSQCHVHDLAVSLAALDVYQTATVLRNLVANCTGNGHGIACSAGNMMTFMFNTIHDVGGSGIVVDSLAAPTGLMVQGNIISKCGRFGMESNAGGLARTYGLANNAYGGGSVANLMGLKANLDDDGTVNPVDAYLTSGYPGDVVTSGDPFVDTANGDYRLNSEAGEALQGTGPAGSVPATTVSGASDFGMYQGGGLAGQPAVGGQSHGFYYF